MPDIIYQVACVGMLIGAALAMSACALIVALRK